MRSYTNTLGTLVPAAILAFTCLATATADDPGYRHTDPSAASVSHPQYLVPEAEPVAVESASLTTPTAAQPQPRPRYKPKPAPKPYKGVFYNNDFSYLEDPCNDQCYLGDVLKRNRIGCRTVLDIGGEYRMRHMSEDLFNRNDYLLHRTRLYTNLEIGDAFRVYGEGIDAVSEFEDVPPRPIDENRLDVLNLFADAKLVEADRGDLWFRFGRQELLYGAQRLISPLDWANTRRTFDGANFIWEGQNWRADTFVTRPVSLWQHLPATDHNFDNPDQSQEFSGIYLTRKGLKNKSLDVYFLRYTDDDGIRDFSPDFEYNTIGARLAGNYCNWLWEIEGAYQFGDYADLDHSAGFYTLGAGRKLAKLPWNTDFWVYYDWASGDSDPNDGTNGTFNQLFPLGHKYFGWMDIIGRQNIEDLNVRITTSPHERVKLILWYHVFHLQQARDALYNPLSAPVRRDPTGAAGQNVGQELDMAVDITLTPRVNLLFGYCHFYTGSFINNTGGIDGEDFYFGQMSCRF